MSAKFLNVFTDDNPELHKQMGCMPGIFQMFDRQHLLTGRRLGGHSQKRLPSGHALSNSASVVEERVAYSPRIVLEKNFSKSWNENQGVSMESSRTSFSSSSCSSFSSLDCNRSVQQELPPTDRIIFPDKPLKNSPKLKSSDSDSGLDFPDPLIKRPNIPAESGHQFLDIRNVVKGSIYKDNRGLSVKTSGKEAKDHQFNHEDATRPTQLPESLDNGVQGRSKVPMDINESLRVLAKLKESPWSASEANQQPRMSYDARDPFSRPPSKDAPRFSYDGREADSKLREVPRLSLDIKKGPLWASHYDPNQNSNMKKMETTRANEADNAALEKQQEQATNKRPTSVVAKLMGLEELPKSTSAADRPVKPAPNHGRADFETFMGHDSSDATLKPAKVIQERKQEPDLCLPNSSHQDSVTRRPKNPGTVMRSMPNSRLPIEPAPWKQQDRIVLPQKIPKGFREAYARKQPVSVYSQIEKKLNELEFQQSNKDLRALKQILDSMQAKGLLHSKKREDFSREGNFGSNNDSPDGSLISNPAAKSKKLPEQVMSLIEGSSAYRSPIVIMKPAKSVNLSTVSDASSVIPLGDLPGLPKLRTSNSAMDRKKFPVKTRIAKEQTPKSSPRLPPPLPLVSDRKTSRRSEENSRQKSNSPQILDNSFIAQHPPQGNSVSSAKHTNSNSPRLQQKKLETDRRSRPPVPSPESTKIQKLSTNRNPLESVSPRSKIKRKPSQAQENNNRLSEVSGRIRSVSHQGDDISGRSDSNVSLSSEVEIEVTSADKSTEMNISFFPEDGKSPSGRNTGEKKSSNDMDKELSASEPASTTPEQPSPISVLDPSFDQDYFPPMSKTSNTSRGDDNYQASKVRLRASGMPNTKEVNVSTEFNHKKLENVENLLQKLKQFSLNSNDDAPAVDHIAFLCETQSPDHRYISEILLASGLLMKDMSSGQIGSVPMQLHPSGYPINPDLFLVLEQRKSGWLARPEVLHENKTQPKKPDPKKLHRKLMFDTVNELLVQNFELGNRIYPTDLLFWANNAPEKIPSGQQLLRKLCSEIEQLKNKRSSCNEDSNVIPDEEVVRKLEGWTNLRKDIPGIILEVERSIFKELVDEVVTGEAVPGLPAKANRRRRQLFVQ